MKDTELFPQLIKSLKNVIQLFIGVRCHVAGPHHRLTVTDRWIDRGSRKDPRLKEFMAEDERLHFAADYDRNNGRLRRANVKAQTPESRVHFSGIAPEVFHAFGFLLHDLECLQNSARYGGSQRGGKYKTPRLVLQVIDDVTRARDEASHRAQRLREGSHHEVDFFIQSKVAHGAFSAMAEDPQRVGLVHINTAAKFLRHLQHLGEVYQVSRHAKHTVDHQKFSAFFRKPTQTTPQGFRGIVGERDGLGRRLPTPVQNARVVFAIAQDVIPVLEKRRENPLIDKETGRKKKGRLPTQKFRQLLFQLLMNGQRAV